MFGPVTRKMRPASSPGAAERSQSFADERHRPARAGGLRAKRLFHHRMPAAGNGKGERAVDLRPAIVLFLRQHRQGGGDVEPAQPIGDFADRFAGADDGGRQRVENSELQLQRLMRGAGDLRFQLGQLGGGEPDRARQRLAVDEAGVERRRQHALGRPRSDLDEVAQHVVVLDAERAEIGLGGVARLQRGDHPPRVVAEPPRLVEFAVVALADEAAIGLEVRQTVAKRRRQVRHQPGRRAAQRGQGIGDLGRRILAIGDGQALPAPPPPVKAHHGRRQGRAELRRG